MLKRTLNKNEGYFLVTTFIIMAVLLTMGAVVLNISLSEFKQSERNKNQIKAYYLARSGAELAADAIKNGDIEAENSIFKIKKDSEIIAEIDIKEESLSNPNKINYKIKSSASAGSNNISETVILNLKREEITSLFNNAIFTKGDINLGHNNSEIKGNNPDNPGGKPSVESHGNVFGADNTIISLENSKKPMPSIPYFPNFGDDGFKTDKNISENNEIKTSGYYGDIKINKKNEGLIIDTRINNGKDKDINILLDSINITSEITIKGEGRVSIFINDNGEFKTKNMRTDQLFVFLAEDASFTTQANGDFNGYIYGPDADVTMNSKKTKFTGAIVSRNLYKNKSSINNKKDKFEFQGTVTYKKPSSEINDSFNPIFTKGKWE